MKWQDCLNWFIQAEYELLLLFINQNDCRETVATELQLAVFTECKFCQKKKTDPGKSHTFSAPLVMTYEVWQLAANCSSFSLSHRSNLMLGAKLLRHETSMWYKSSLVRRQMRKTNEGKQTRKKEKNRLSVTAWKPVPSSFFSLHVAGGRAGCICERRSHSTGATGAGDVIAPQSFPAPSICHDTFTYTCAHS